MATIAGEEFLRFDEVTERPLSECLLYLSYLSDKALMEKLTHKENMAKYKSK